MLPEIQQQKILKLNKTKKIKNSGYPEFFIFLVAKVVYLYKL